MGGEQAAYGAWCQVVLGPRSISFSLRGSLVATPEGGIMAWGYGIGVLAGSREKNASWCVPLRNLIPSTWRWVPSSGGTHFTEEKTTVQRNWATCPAPWGLRQSLCKDAFLGSCSFPLCDASTPAPDPSHHSHVPLDTVFSCFGGCTESAMKSGPTLFSWVNINHFRRGGEQV